MPSLPSVPFLGLSLARATTSEFIEWLIGRAASRDAPTRVGYLNAAMFNLACESPEFAECLARLECLYADGQSVVRAARRLGAPVPERISAGDFAENFFAACAESNLTIALVGGYPGQAERFAESCPPTRPRR